MCIFDDIDVISDKLIREAVYNILDQILEIGRHFKIHCIVTYRHPNNTLNNYKSGMFTRSELLLVQKAR